MLEGLINVKIRMKIILPSKSTFKLLAGFDYEFDARIYD